MYIFWVNIFLESHTDDFQTVRNNKNHVIRRIDNAKTLPKKWLYQILIMKNTYKTGPDIIPWESLESLPADSFSVHSLLPVQLLFAIPSINLRSGFALPLLIERRWSKGGAKEGLSQKETNKFHLPWRLLILTPEDY